LAVVALAGPPAGADPPPVSDPTITDAPSTTTTADTTSTTAGGSSTTDSVSTTTATGPAAAPQNQNDDDLVGRGFYTGQAPFDPAAKNALPADVQRAQRELGAARQRQQDADAALAAVQHQVDDLHAQLAELADGQRQAVEDTARARSAFVDRAVTAYMHGRESESFAILQSDTPIEYARRTQLLGAVLDSDIAVATDYQRRRDALDADLQTQTDRLDDLTRQAADAQLVAATDAAVASAAEWQLRAFQDGSRLWVPGFVFPVEGPVQFVDSFGYPREVGTGQQHWHEGCDVMADRGTPLVAVEDGVVTSVGENLLGGQSVKITGASGYWYYYAHLSAFAPDLVEGMPVTAGTVIGFVGNTGDAAGGPTHVHFEAHQPDGQVLDSFGLLKAAWQARQDQLDLGGTDPVHPPDPASHPDPGTPGGFPRFPDGRPVYADPARQPAADAPVVVGH
jgi:murein DD-endopeptidase MepM/ murein hydrolase activator NlpD